MILASILITDETQEAAALPPPVAQNIETFKAVHPGLEHHLFRGPELRALIARDFGGGVLAAYDTLKPYAFQCDLARHCVMYKYGGVYADLSVYFLKGWTPEHWTEGRWRPGQLGVFRDFVIAAPWQVANTLYFAPPGHAALSAAIELICRNVANRYYGGSFLSPTGPDSFGKALALSCEAADLVSGKSAWVTEADLPGVIDRRAHGFAFGGEIVAVKRKPGGGSLDGMGIAGGNSYVEMWERGDIYR
jgi:hypothetical protein